MRATKTGGTRMLQLFERRLIKNKGGQCLDLYNQAVWDDVFVTVTTRIDQCNHYWVTQVIET